MMKPYLSWNMSNLFYEIVSVFANAPEDRGSIPDRITRKTKKKIGTWYLLA